ncbi:mitochondrial genome maintenance protein MGM101 [Drechmeria coniospora]|uniref:Mitochondrial genome maintenance protein MGM101 n=1 Tax=Drechmeria coniospora TaxID=98403 RepID=A0A151GT04_DRECN|nr:mitochondrial genome maintenance protein MGM101 [Drechmeria coniospora]KYK60249.1 mitochondrial genome maintenance protein MGM101 [Drechmeria coniospora]ODA80191.1 hypothetical protein RJ55_03149 [Drechmeria coniospora]
MSLSGRIATAAPRQFIRRAPSVALLFRHHYATEAAAVKAIEDVPSSSMPTATTPPTTVASKWTKVSKAKVSTVAKPVITSVPSRALYEAKTIAHQPQAAGASAEDPLPAQEISGVDWANSFHGISARPVSEVQFRVLMQPLDHRDIEVKPDGVIYLPEIKYRRRLNEAFGPMGWGIIPKGESVVGNAVVTREYALIVDGRFASQAQGENSFFSPDQLPSAVEGCKSNALMRCCKDLGVASELWDPHFVRWFKKTQMEEVWVEHTTTKKKRTFWYRKGEVDVAYPYKLAK